MQNELETVARLDALLSHVWMVRTFIKHSEEAEDDDDLRDIQRLLYDTMLALGPAWQAQDAPKYMHVLKKKISKLKEAARWFEEIQPDVSSHMNFQMAVRSLNIAVEEVIAELATS